MHLPSHLVHIYDVRPVIGVRVDTHTDQFPQLQGKSSSVSLTVLRYFYPHPHVADHMVPQMVVLSPSK